MFANLAGPPHAAQARKCFAQNLLLKPHLLGNVDVLVMAAAANPEVGAGRGDALCRGLLDLHQVRVNQLLFPAAYRGADFFPGQDVRHKNRVAIGVAHAFTAINHLLN